MLSPFFSSLLLSTVEEVPCDPSTQRVFLASKPLSLFDKNPPKEVRLLEMGPNYTIHHGVVWVDEQSIQECLALEAALGRDLCWDWNHYSEPNGPKPPPGTDINQAKKAAGWFSLEGRPDGLYAVMPRHRGPKMGLDGILWTPEGAANVCNQEYGNWSPAILTVERGGRTYASGCTSAALTNFPETLGQPPLLCAAQGTLMTWAQLLASLQARGASDAEINAAKVAFDAGQATANQNLLSVQQTAQQTAAKLNQIETDKAAAEQRNKDLEEKLKKEKRERIFLSYDKRFDPAEKPVLEKMDPDDLESLLKVRKDDPLRGQPLQLAAPSQTSPITGGNNPVCHNGRPWEQTNYRERHVILLSNPDLYGQMRQSARDRGVSLGRVEKEHMGRPVFGIRRTVMLAVENRIIEQLKARRMMLATGTTTSADIVEIIPEILNDAIEAGFAGVRVFQNSPVVMQKNTLPNFDANRRPIKGGSKITVPYFEPISGFTQVTDPTSIPSTNQKLETTEEEASVQWWRCGVQLTYEAEAFAQEGSDPYNESERQLLEQARQAMEAGLITEVRTTTLEKDISTQYLSYDAFVDTLALWGDEEFEDGMKSNALVFMHSNSLRQVRQIKDAQGLPIFMEAQDGGTPMVLGMKTRISDSLSTVGGAHVLSIVKSGALALWVNQSKFRVQTFHDVSDDTDLNVVHLYFAPHLYKRPPRRTKCAAVSLKHKALA